MESLKGKYWFGVIFILITTLVFSAYLPWWGFLGFALVLGFFIELTDQRSFTCGLLGAGLAFLIKMVLVNGANESILASKIGALFGLQGAVGLILVSTLLFGLLGGLAVWSGKLFREQLGI